MGSPGGAGGGPGGVGGTPGGTTGNNAGGGGSGPGGVGASPGANAGAAAGAAAAAAGAQAAAGAKAAASQSKSTNAVGNMGAAKSAGAAAAAAQGAAAQAAKASAVGLGGAGAKAGTQGPNAAAGAAAAHAASAAAAGGLAKAAAAAGSKTTGPGGPFGGLGKAGLGAPNAAGAAAATNAAAKANAAGLSGPSKSTGTPGGISGGAMAAREAASKAGGGLAAAAARASPSTSNAGYADAGTRAMGAYNSDKATALGLSRAVGQGPMTASQQEAANLVGSTARQMGMDPAQAMGVANLESNHFRAINDRDKYGGVMQLGPEAFKSMAPNMNPSARLNIGTNIMAGLGYLGKYGGSTALAGYSNYNQGPGAAAALAAHPSMSPADALSTRTGVRRSTNVTNVANNPFGSRTPAKTAAEYSARIARALSDAGVNPAASLMRSNAPNAPSTPTAAPAAAPAATPTTHPGIGLPSPARNAAMGALSNVSTRPSVGPGIQSAMGALSQAKTMGTNPAMGALSQAKTMGTNPAMSALSDASVMGTNPAMGALSQAKTMGTNPAMGALSQAKTMGTDMAQAAMAQAQTMGTNPAMGALSQAKAMGTNPAMGAFGQAQTMGTNPAMSALGGVTAGTPAALGGMIGAAMNPGTPNQMNAPSAPATGLAMRSGAAFPGGSTAATPSASSPASTPANIVNRESAPGVTPTSYHDAVIDAKNFLGGSFPNTAMAPGNQPGLMDQPGWESHFAPPSHVTQEAKFNFSGDQFPGGSVNVGPPGTTPAHTMAGTPPTGPASTAMPSSYAGAVEDAKNFLSNPGYTDPGMAPRNPQETNIARNLPAAAPPSAPSQANIVNKESAPGVTPGAPAAAAAAPAAETAIPEAQPTPFNPENDIPKVVDPKQITQMMQQFGITTEYSSYKAWAANHLFSKQMAAAGVQNVGQAPSGGWSIHMKDGTEITTDPKSNTFTVTSKDGAVLGNLNTSRVSSSMPAAPGFNLGNLASMNLTDQSKPSTPSPAAPAAPAAPGAPQGVNMGSWGYIGPERGFAGFPGGFGSLNAPQMGQPGQQPGAPGMPGMPQMGQPQGPSMAPPGGLPPGMQGPSHFGPPTRAPIGLQGAPIGNPMGGPSIMGSGSGGGQQPPPQQQPMMGLLSPMMSASAAPAPTTPPVDPTAPGRIPVSSMGGSAGSLADLFKAVDKGVAASTGSSGAGSFDPKNPWNYYSGQQFDKSNKPGNIPEGWRLASNADGSAFTLVNQTPEYTAAQKDRAAAIQAMNGGKSSSNTAFNDANSFLQSLGLSGSSPSTSGGGSKKSSAAASPSLIKTSAATATTTDPNRIPVSTGTASGSITTKPDGVSGSDWKKYQSLSAKLANSKSISSKNQKWYDAFTAKNGGTTGGTGGGTGGGGGGTSIPGNPQQVAPDVGLLTRPYDNPFERRNLWNLFPPTNTSGGVRG